MKQAPETVAIIGAGSWGTALAVQCARVGLSVRLWARSPDVARAIAATGRNPWYLTDIEIAPGVMATDDLERALEGAAFVVVAVPSEFVAATLERARGVPRRAALVSATKGLDPERLQRMTELLASRFPGRPVAALSGPTFAREVALGQPTACVVASEDDALAARLQTALGSREFRLYTNRDVVGVEIGGALKNVVALATGLADGLGLGENSRAGLITRGLAEVTRLAVALGAAPATLAGLAGVGDLVLTCTGGLSRNRALGVALGRGTPLAVAEGGTRMIAEGVRTVRSALALAQRHRVRLPICEEVGAVLFDGKSPAEALDALLGRAATREDLPAAAMGARGQGSGNA
ncbi:MAG TPA: NAD(P)H-dependent glycerol-3-phosphate dehydrogenase [Methylomirabilota bacterium]|jgi:glycerol-3-phosphate dehydrogenase (NAD(P)+)